MTSTATTYTTAVAAHDADLNDLHGQLELDRTCADLRARCSLEYANGQEGAQLFNTAEALAEAAGANPLTGEPYYTTADILGWVARAIEFGAARPRLRAVEVEDVFRHRRVPNAKLREEYERRSGEGEEGLSAVMARAMGAVKDGKPDTSAALRAIGVETVPGGNRPGGGRYEPSLRLFLSYEHAVAIAGALDIDFHDLGV